MTQYLAIGLFIAFLAVGSFGALAQLWILVEMVEQVNQKKESGQKLDAFPTSWRRTSWPLVLREYRSMYPTGNLARRFTGVIVAIGISWLGLVILLFGVLPHRSHYSR